jgi:hypothetical protein
MKHFNAIPPMILIVLFSAVSGFAQRNVSLGDNRALRYWSAYSEIQDSAVTDQQAKELNAILDGTAPYDDSKYRELLEKNALALDIMARGTSLPNCDWGLDYGLGDDLPGDYVKKALVLGRLNVLYAFHSFIVGNKEQGVRALVAGLRFSHDVASGGSLFATLIAKDLIVTHLRAVGDALHLEQLSAAQRLRLQQALRGLGEGLDWRTAAKRDLETLRGHHAADPQTSAALTQIIADYVAFLDDPSKLPLLNRAMNSAPQQLSSLIPNARRVLEQKQDLNNRLLETRSLLE